MRWIICGLIVGLFFLSAVGQVGAQDATAVVSPTEPAVTTRSLRDVIAEYNICPQELLEANRAILSLEMAQYLESTTPRFLGWLELPANVMIPPHAPCYYIVQAPVRDLPRIEAQYNICIEDFYENALTSRSYDNEAVTTWYLWRGALPCVNRDGQRLQYQYAHMRRWGEAAYNDLPLITATADITEIGYCLNELVAANPDISFNEHTYYGLPYMEGMRLFVPHDARRCRALPPTEGQTAYMVSLQTNVCIEDIVEASDLKRGPLRNPVFFIPVDAQPCYDADGHRLGVKDREIYTPAPTDSLLDIALKYNVCLNDLWDANPILFEWYAISFPPQRMLPEKIFIPETPPCANPMSYRVPINQTVYEIGGLTNVCWNRIADANPHVQNWGPFVAMGEVLTIPQRPHCFHFPTGLFQAHMCYPIAITAETDLTGHEPPISWSFNTDLPYCYQLADGMTVFYENKPYTLYTSYGSVLYTLQCFQVEDVYTVRMQYKEILLWSEYHRPAYGDWLMIPQPHADCPLLHMDRELRAEWATQHYQMGSLYEGIYKVAPGDTLDSIGWKFGYLPQWIADVNDLSDPNIIYQGEELRMPNIPSLYIFLGMGQISVVFCILGGTVYSLRRWRMRRYNGQTKKKNESA